MFKNKKKQWKQDCYKILDKKGYYQVDELNMFQLWNNARLARKTYKMIMGDK